MLDRPRPHTEVSAPQIGTNQDNERAISFGPFQLFPARHLLLKGRKPVHLGSRALDILIALVERPGELVSKDELMARVWPHTFVEQANLTVHIAALRRALCDGRSGHRFLVNIPGRGYRFVAPVHSQLCNTRPTVVEHAHNLPAPVSRLIGREDVVVDLSEQFSRDRLLTLVGPGGVGKTSVALAVAQQRIGKHRHGVRLIDLALAADSSLFPTVLASTLGIESRVESSLQDVVSILKDRDMLIVLDNCEHLVEAAARFVAELLRSAPGIHILATSREALRTEGERVYRLPALETAAIAPSAEEALRFSAIQLFVDRTAAALGKYELSDVDAPIVASICHRLEGLPLAIELAASRVSCFGIGGLAARLDDPLRLLISGSRTAAPRQHTMRATLDWSYELLCPPEQAALRRLSIFVGTFTLSQAEAVVSDDTRSSNERIDHVMELIVKSLIVADVSDAAPRLRLFKTTRAYALAKLIESGEFDTIAGRYAECVAGTQRQRPSTRQNLKADAVRLPARILPRLLPPESSSRAASVAGL